MQIIADGGITPVSFRRIHGSVTFYYLSYDQVRPEYKTIVMVIIAESRHRINCYQSLSNWLRYPSGLMIAHSVRGRSKS